MADYSGIAAARAVATNGKAEKSGDDEILATARQRLDMAEHTIDTRLRDEKNTHWEKGTQSSHSLPHRQNFSSKGQTGQEICRPNH